MSRSGTVRCSHCWNHGHNVRGCPQLRKQAAKGVPFAVRRLDRIKAANKSRACSWCGESGHNARTCGAKQEVLNWIEDTNIKWRTNFANYIRKKGLGPGAIATQVSQAWDRHDRKYKDVEYMFQVIGLENCHNFVSACEPHPGFRYNTGLFTIDVLHVDSGSYHNPENLCLPDHTFRCKIPHISPAHRDTWQAASRYNIDVISPSAESGVSVFYDQIMDADKAVVFANVISYLENRGRDLTSIQSQILKRSLGRHNYNLRNIGHGEHDVVEDDNAEVADLKYLYCHALKAAR